MSVLLTDNLPLLASAPEGIKKLRELILELAVRGRLVPQDPSDEPVSELLKQIAEEKARLVAEKRIKKQKPLAEIGEEEKPFELPGSWAWGRLGELALKITDGTHHSPINTQAGDYKYISAKNIKSWGVDLAEVTYVTNEVHQEIFSRCDPCKGDILYIKDGATTGIATLNSLDEPFSMLSSVALLKPSVGLHNEYLLKAMISPFFYQVMRAGMTGVAITRVTLAKLNNAIIPLPPLPEQHRIVAKVDELMALCDRLEARQTDAESAQARLVQALLDSLTQASDADDFAANWQRLAGHFNSLFTSESSIDALKQTLLQLAVMGKLVPQDPSDEPASESLKRIAEEKARLVKEEGLRTTARDDVPEDEHYLALPRGWAYCRLGNLARFIDYRGKTPTKTQAGIPLITAKNVRPGFISREPQEFIATVDYEAWMTRGFPRIGDMLFTTEAPMGNVALIDISEKFALAQRVICFQLHELLIGPFLKLAIMSSAFQKQLLDASTGMTATGIKASRLKEIPVPLPPLAEQHRIVAKLDQLLFLCDQLKSRLSAARQLHERLAGALVEQAVA